MKKIVLAMLIASSTVMAEGNPFLKDHFPGGYSMVGSALPHLMGMYKKQGGMHKIAPTPEQEELIEERFKIHSKAFMSKATRIRELETAVMKAVVYDGKPSEALKEQLSEISILKNELAVIDLDTIHMFKKTLTLQQYDVLLDMAKQAKK